MATSLPLRPNIYKTPTKIYEAVLRHFPNASARITRTHKGMVKMKLTLAEGMTGTIENFVDTQLFEEQLKTLSVADRLRRAGASPNSFPQLDMHQFSLIRQPLLEWQKFSRIRYESEGKSCVDVLIDYLQNPETRDVLSTLSNLGLTPDLVEDSLGENDLVYFKSAIEKLKTMSKESVARVQRNLQSKYPKVYHHLVTKMVQTDIEKYAQDNPDPYQATVKRLKKHVLGQDHAIKTLAGELSSQKNQEGNATFLFVGPTGVGKTELAKAVGDVKGKLIKFSMNEFQEQTSTSRFFGASPGYVGSTDKPHLAKELDRYANFLEEKKSVEYYEVRDVTFLFDEIEKAHHDIRQSLLNFFDNGEYKADYIVEGGAANRNRNVAVCYKLKKCVVINTSNLHQASILQDFRERLDVSEITDRFCRLNSSHGSGAPTRFAPEWLARNTIIPFGPIPQGECYQKLIDMKLERFVRELKEEIGFKEMIIEEKKLTLSLLESILYAEGVDIRRVERYLSEMKRIIYQYKPKWGKIETVKIIFYPKEGDLFLRVEKFVDSLMVYHPLTDFAPILLPRRV